jgi:DNA polymerase-3 subunit gamma/tau
VENIRNLREQVHYLPQTARRKVYIIDEVHMLTTSAFNALLKTLEEPPPHVNFIFATTEPQKVLPTILSRVSRLDFRRVSPEEAVAHLREILGREELSVDDGGLRLIARASGGSVRDALTLLDQVLAFADDPKAVTEEETRAVLGQAQHSAIAELVDAVLDRDPDAVLARFDGLVNAGHDLMVLSLQLLEHFRDLAVVKVCKGPGVLRGATDSEYERLRAQAGKADASVLGQLFDRFTRVIDRLPQSRVPRLLLEMGLLDLVHAEPLMPLGDLIDRLHALGDGGAPQGGAAGPSGSVGSTAGRGSGRAAGRSGAAHRADAPAEPARLEASVERTAPASTSSSPQGPNGSPRGTMVARTAPASEPRVVEGGPGPSSIGASDSDFTRALWAKVTNDLGDGKPDAGNGRPARTEDHSGETLPARTSGPEAAQPPSNTASTTDTRECGPCSPQVPADGLIAQADREPFAVWEELVARIRAVDEYASAVLSDLALIELAGGVLRVAAPARSFAYTELASRPEIRATLEQACRDHLGAPHEVQLQEGEPELAARPSIVLVAAQRRAEHQAAIEAEAAQHTSIRALLHTFNAKIVTTKPIQ